MPDSMLSGVGPWLEGHGLNAAQAERLLQLGIPPAVGAGINAVAGRDRSPLRRVARGALAGGGAVAGGLLGQYAQQYMGGGLPSYVGPGVGAVLGGLAGYDALKEGQTSVKLSVDVKYPPMGTFLDTHPAQGFNWKKKDEQHGLKCAAILGELVGAKAAASQDSDEESEDPTLSQLELDDEMQRAQRQWAPGDDVGTPLGQIVASPARQAAISGAVGAGLGAPAGAFVGQQLGASPLHGALIGGLGVGSMGALRSYLQQRRTNAAAHQLQR